MSTEKLPEGWVQCELSMLGNIVTGKTPSTKELSYFGGDIPFIKPGDLEFGGNINTTADTLTDKGLTVVPSLPPSSLVVTCIGNLGKVGITTKRSATNQQINSLIPNPRLCVKFIYYQMLTLKPWLESQSVATTIAIVNKGKFSQAPIKVPAVAEQKIIAEKLDTLLAQVDTTKARLEQVPQILKRFRQAVLAAAVGGKLTEEWRGTATLNDWKKGILKNFIKKPSYGTSAKSQKEGLIPVLRMGNLQSGKLDWSDLVYTSDRNEIEKYKLIAGDILFNRTNSPELVGKTSIFRGEREAIYAGYLIKIQCLDGLNSEYLNYHLNSHIAKQYCYEVKSDGVSQSNINAQKLAAYPLEVPPIEEQAEIVRRVEQLFVYADTIEKQVNNALSRVNNLTQSILAKAFRGELTAQWRVENPDLISGENSAAALLEKIKAERAASGNKKASRKKK
ncbi:restriction endonuclease subunit S [Proteus mirabilis]|uniref:restriction endonuclease subunit S n=1 Tax=Proteus sp. G4441 TaxID=2698864 RepID=UPI000665A16B|nr:MULTISPECIES: restriction endonuclease subunit S [Proteus]EKW1742956.1 restriction endonuclease subunit S [Proteus mirabilis]MBO8261818.1 restriction endonuclease subunit S [Proteus mirabilis]MBO8265408.1 restriction endonuclease subunit S [Proteus mirabilis]MBO8268325.1 restriction endonuclease subunit S [Proteus mirabilis]MBO8273246.1 restriction endonuclease subunit S [Proteus mirabilis]